MEKLIYIEQQKVRREDEERAGAVPGGSEVPLLPNLPVLLPLVISSYCWSSSSFNESAWSSCWKKLSGRKSTHRGHYRGSSVLCLGCSLNGVCTCLTMDGTSHGIVFITSLVPGLRAGQLTNSWEIEVGRRSRRRWKNLLLRLSVKNCRSRGFAGQKDRIRKNPWGVAYGRIRLAQGSSDWST